LFKEIKFSDRMGFDNKVNTSDSVRAHWKSKPKDFADDDLSFLQWFDNHKTKKSYWSSGFIDLNLRILTKNVIKALEDPSDKKCLEIGFGGGRLLNAATHMFDFVYGVDIHDCFKKTSTFLQNKNYKLITPEAISEIDNESIDLVYSFITFQHFDSVDTFNFYLKEIARVLKPGKPCVIFYGLNRYNEDDYLELTLEKMSDVRGSSLFLNPDFVGKKCAELGIKLLEHSIPPKKPWLDASKVPSNSQACFVGIKKDSLIEIKKL